MEASPLVVAAYEQALPDDPRVERKRMFGMPCAFVNRQMFFGTFDASVVARIGPARVAALDGIDGLRVFTPMAERPWRDYVQVDVPGDEELMRQLAAESLEWTARLPPKAKKPKVAKRTKSKA